MPTRTIAAAAALVLVLAACSTSPAASGPVATGPLATGALPTPGEPMTTATAINLSDVDVCAIVGEGVAEALTGETGFDADGSADPSSAKCFWAVPRPGVPQYLDVQVFRRTDSLGDYTPTVSGAVCTGATVSGVGTEASGGVCTGTQQKVYLVAMDRGVAVQVLVNEPKGTLTPADLVDTVNAVIAGLG